MKFTWRDIIATAAAVLGAITVFARLKSYSWALIGSWKGALGVVAVLGLVILLTNIIELVQYVDFPSFGETALWIFTASLIVSSLVVTTTKAEFASSSILVGLSWLAQLTRHTWVSTHEHNHGLMHHAH